jgi:hypothetical protein
MERMNLFLDSGAFSAFTKNIEINILDYIAFIKKHEDIISYYAVLDVIGDSEKTLENQRIMEDHGLSPVPCFHANEDYKYLQFYVDNYDYIALGGVAVNKSPSKRGRWLYKCFDIICDENDYPKCKVHGFALTSIDLMWKYPWFSVDSSRWVKASRYGKIFIPEYNKDGTLNYTRNPIELSVSNISLDRTSTSTFNALSTHVIYNDKDITVLVKKYLSEIGVPLGISEVIDVSLDYKLVDDENLLKQTAMYKKIERIIEPGVINFYKHRDKANLIYFKNLEESFPPWPPKWDRDLVKHSNMGSILS